MRRVRLLAAGGGTAAWATLVSLGLAAAPAAAHAASVKGFVQESVALRTSDGDDVLFHRQTLHTELTASPSRRLSLRLEADILRDDADFQADGAEISSRIREAYLKLRFRNFDLRLGRIQIGWGEADGLIVSDQVSPFDLTYFIVPKFDEIRLGIDGATLDYYFPGGNELQLIWVGKFTGPDFPDSDSPWSFVDAEVLAASGLSLAASDKPSGRFSNSEFGLRVSGHPLAADWSLGYLRSWDDRPALKIAGTEAVPTHELFDLLTFNLVWPVAGMMVRLDSAYERGRLLSTDATDPAALDTAAAGFVAREDVWRTLVALDLKPDIGWWQQADLSLQLSREEVMSPHRALASAGETHLAIVRLSAAYLNDTVKPWVLLVADLGGDNSWLQTKIDWEPADNWRLGLEYDRFTGHAWDGDSGGVYGSFDKNDMVSATARYSF